MNDNNEIEQRRATLEHLDQEIAKKTQELIAIQSNCNESNRQIQIRLNELNERLENVNRREKEIALLKQDLEAKLTEVEAKLTETQKLTKELKANNSFIIKQYQ